MLCMIWTSYVGDRITVQRVLFISCWQNAKQSAGAMWLSVNIVRGKIGVYSTKFTTSNWTTLSSWIVLFDNFHFRSQKSLVSQNTDVQFSNLVKNKTYVKSERRHFVETGRQSPDMRSEHDKSLWSWRWHSQFTGGYKFQITGSTDI